MDIFKSFFDSVHILFMGFWGLFVILFMISLLGVILNLRNQRNIRDSLQSDISDQALKPPGGIRYIADLQNELGIRRLGEVQSLVKGEKFVTWCFVDQDETVVSEVVDLPTLEPMLQFSTWFSDEALVETIYPAGENINDPFYRSHGIGTTIEDAYQHHINQVKDFQRSHGAPMRLGTMHEWMERELVFQRLYRDRKNKSQFFRQHIVPTLAYFYAAMVLFGLGMAEDFIGSPLLCGGVVILSLPFFAAIIWSNLHHGRKPVSFNEEHRSPEALKTDSKLVYAFLLFVILGIIFIDLGYGNNIAPAVPIITFIFITLSIINQIKAGRASKGDG